MFGLLFMCLGVGFAGTSEPNATVQSNSDTSSWTDCFGVDWCDYYNTLDSIACAATFAQDTAWYAQHWATCYDYDFFPASCTQDSSGCNVQDGQSWCEIYCVMISVYTEWPMQLSYFGHIPW